MNDINFSYPGVAGSVAARVVDITSGKILFVGTFTECRSWKRKHYGQFNRIYLA